MMSKSVSTFGKRGRPAMVRPAAARPGRVNFETTESGLPLSVLAASLMQRPAEAETIERRTGGTVPYSWRAGLLAGLVVSLMQAGLVIVGATAQSSSLAGLASLTGVSTQMVGPIVLAGSLFNSAETIVFTIFVAHRLLKRFAITSHGAYALGGAATAAVLAAAWLVLGFGAPTHGWLIEIATGLGAGFFYRLFAGATAPAT